MKNKNLRISQKLLDEVMAQARQSPQEEICGILGGGGGLALERYPIPNVSPTPAYHFVFEGQSFVTAYLKIESGEMDLVAIYHSHPRAAEAVPSSSDVANANYPEALNLIVSFDGQWNPIARVYEIVNGQVTEVGLEIVSDN